MLIFYSGGGEKQAGRQRMNTADGTEESGAPQHLCQSQRSFNGEQSVIGEQPRETR